MYEMFMLLCVTFYVILQYILIMLKLRNLGKFMLKVIALKSIILTLSHRLKRNLDYFDMLQQKQ